MKLLSTSVDNFGSYEHLDFDFDNQGLALVYGATGSGKSTLLDIPTWCLFGQTAKGGKADDIRPWSIIEPTRVKLTVEVQSSKVEITRVRGRENDLYYTEEGAPDVKIRGKDLTETQRLLEKRLSVDFSSYTAAAYSCDASPSQVFFLAPAKSRRELFEKITDLSLPARLTERVQNAKKSTRKIQTEVQSAYDKAAGRVESVSIYLERAAKDSDTWDATQAEKIKKLQTLRDNFDLEKASKIAALKTKADVIDARIQDTINKLQDKYNKLQVQIKPEEILVSALGELKASSRCEFCGGILKDKELEVAQLEDKIRSNQTKIEQIKDLQTQICCLAVDEELPHRVQAINNAYLLENHYQDQLAEELYRENPYEAQWKRLQADFEASSSEYTKLESALNEVTLRYKALVHLQDLASDLRAALLHSSVSQIQDKTNTLLEKYFEGAFRVGFTVSGDSLDISIQKSGYECSYLQLSKGQRRLLTLCFSVAVMEATSNNIGIHFDCLMFDEPTDGCDAELKIAAYALFEDLAYGHPTVLIIEHDRGLQNEFQKKFRVELVGDHSELEEE